MTSDKQINVIRSLLARERLRMAPDSPRQRRRRAREAQR
jgi:hypothetical protein